MAQGDNPIDDYLARLPKETEEQRFLRSVPWVLDAGAQDHGDLARDLRDEAPRLAALPRKPVFSLLTPMYNTPIRLLRELILSVRCQSWPHWELLLVDDGSPKKDHIETAREWANRDSRIKLHVCDENRGISGARNVAIEKIPTGTHLAILDHDDIIHPMALGPLRPRPERRPQRQPWCSPTRVPDRRGGDAHLRLFLQAAFRPVHPAAGELRLPLHGHRA